MSTVACREMFTRNCPISGCVDRPCARFETNNEIRWMPDVITWKKNDMAQSLDEYFYLVGDEDTNVGLQCKSCDRGGLPVVYYTTNPKDDSYKDDDVVIVNSIQELVDQGSLHMLEHQR